MLKHLFLPRSEGEAPKMPEVAGKWDANSQRILRTIADGIVPGEHAVARGVSSVPDIWARPLMFASALRTGSRHPLRDRLVNEWRGLLSLIALSRVRKFDLQLVRVPLVSGVFADALKRLKPEPVFLEAQKAYSWTDIVIIKYDGIPVGGLSPQTLAFTGTDYAHRLATTTLDLKTPEGFLRPPINEEDQHAVAEWVVQLQRRFAGILHADAGVQSKSQATVGLINRLLKDWEIELRGQLGLSERDDVDSPEVEIDEDPLRVNADDTLLASHRIYRELLRPLARTDDGTRAATDVALRGKRNLSGHSTVVVISRSLIGGNARIWDSKRLNNLGGDIKQVLARHFNAASGTVIDKEDLAKDKAIWIRPERFFLSDVLIKAKGGANLVAGAEAALNSDTRFLMPFRREILDFFSPEDLQQLTPAFTQESDQGITFRFKLPVGSQLETVEKTYRYKNPGEGQGTVTDVDVPAVELFPRFLDSSWRRYFLFQQGADAVVAAPIVKADNVSFVTREHIDGRGRKVRVTGTIADAVRSADDAIQLLPFPEAVEFVLPSGAPGGLLLLARPPQPGPRSAEWGVGIDFGTSNTNVFRKSSRDAEAERWSFLFPDHIQRLTEPSDTSRSEQMLPMIDVPLPVPTHLRIHQEPHRQHVLLDYFMDLSAAYDIPETVYTNIKWHDKDRKTEYFLESLLLMILIDAVKHRIDTVQFACSYPKAFSQNAIGVFKGEWQKVVRRMLEGPARFVDMRSGANDGRLNRKDDVFEVEGVAAGEYFASDKTIRNSDDRANKANVALCLDVGGGTTDISLWFDNEIVADASVKLAGREIGEMLRRHFKILELLLSSDAVCALEGQQGQPEPFAARLNIALRREDVQIQEMLIKHSNAREIQALKRLLVCEFGAIAFYAAQVIVAADRKVPGGEILKRIESSGIGLHWGGNAARFINWIDFGKFDKSGIGPMILNAVMYIALQDAGVTVSGKRLAQHQSPAHKSEAAGGLVVMEHETHRRGSDEIGFDMVSDGISGPVCGENIETTSGKIAYLDPLTEGALFKEHKTTFVRTSLDRLKRFLEIVNHFGVQRGVFTNESKISLDENRAVQIADSVRAQFIVAQGKNEGHREIEPVFIMEVKVLLDKLKEELGR